MKFLQSISWATMSLSPLLMTAMAGDMRLSITVISASSSTARQRRAGRSLPPRRIHPNRKATKGPICGAGPWIGARLAFGRSSPRGHRQARRHLVWNASGRSFPLKRSRADWEMMRALWDHPKRKQWSGGGADLPGLH